MNRYTVIYVIEDEGINWQFFNTTADSPDHAEEQCLNAYPSCKVLWVNEGHNVTTME